ncbi:MAG: FAD:protein FMN transferase [Pseudomonadales bacterium]|nr:FAD:protein FMN transferase [Pseudomonadales bacterium]
MHKIQIITFLIVISVTNHASADWFKKTMPVMGTSVMVELWHVDSELSEAIVDEVFQEIYRIENLMSPYLPDSGLSRINQNAYSMAVKPDAELFAVIEQALLFSVKTEGAFDISFASVGHRFNYREGKKPNAIEFEKLRSLIDYRLIKLNPQNKTIRFQRSGVKLDLGGIAKGYAVDKAIELLRQWGIQYAIVTAGGDSRILGDRKGRPWIVGIKNPRADNVLISLPLENAAVSTSGDYERFFEKEGVRYHHIINPKTGHSADSLRSVTIIGDDAMMTDALSTSVFVMGIHDGLALLESIEDISGVLIDQANNVHYTSDLIGLK